LFIESARALACSSPLFRVIEALLSDGPVVSPRMAGTVAARSIPKMARTTNSSIRENPDVSRLQKNIHDTGFVRTGGLATALAHLPPGRSHTRERNFPHSPEERGQWPGQLDPVVSPPGPSSQAVAGATAHQALLANLSKLRHNQGYG
jgi:hypothetical protein